jgi:hypothetical protein
MNRSTLFQSRDTRSYRYLTVKLKAGNLSNSKPGKAKGREVTLDLFEYFSWMLRKAEGHITVTTGLMLVVMLEFWVFSLCALTGRIGWSEGIGAEIHHILSLLSAICHSPAHCQSDSLAVNMVFQ